MAAQDAAAAAAEAQMRSLEQRGKAEMAEANMLQEISVKSGVPLNDLIEMRKIKAIEQMNGEPQLVVNVDKPTPKP